MRTQSLQESEQDSLAFQVSGYLSSALMKGDEEGTKMDEDDQQSRSTKKVKMNVNAFEENSEALGNKEGSEF